MNDVIREVLSQNDVTRETLSQYVQRILRQKRLRLADVERRCGKTITSSYISRIIKGTVTNLTVDKIDALARGLDVDPHAIFTVALGKSPQEAGAQSAVDSAVFVDTVQKLLIHPELLELVQLFARITPAERQAMLGTLKYAAAPKRRLARKQAR